MHQLALLVLYIIGLALASILIADLISAPGFQPLRYYKAKIELDRAISEYRKLKEKRILDKRSERKARKLLGEINERRRIVVRASFFRLIILLPLYLAAAISVSSITIPIPSPCCIPILTLQSSKGICFLLPSTLLLLAYIAFLPFIQESLIGLVLAKRQITKKIETEKRKQ